MLESPKYIVYDLNTESSSLAGSECRRCCLTRGGLEGVVVELVNCRVFCFSCHSVLYFSLGVLGAFFFMGRSCDG